MVFELKVIFFRRGYEVSHVIVKELVGRTTACWVLSLGHYSTTLVGVQVSREIHDGYGLIP